MRSFAFLLPLILIACSRPAQKAPEGPMTLSLTSPAFAANGPIPAVHTCDGRDLSPPLAWSGVPPAAKSLALVVDDPDAPRGTWVHWVVYNLPPSAAGLAEGAGSGALPAGALGGVNDFKRASYDGPCPPSGRHRYFHKLYALDIVVEGMDGPTASELERAMQGHVLARGELVGTYERAR